jgi:hypothetical protein
VDTLAEGARVTLTRTMPDRRTYRITGVLTDIVRDDDDRLRGGRITGHDVAGNPDDSYFALDAEQMLQLYGVVQTLEHAQP